MAGWTVEGALETGDTGGDAGAASLAGYRVELLFKHRVVLDQPENPQPADNGEESITPLAREVLARSDSPATTPDHAAATAVARRQAVLLDARASASTDDDGHFSLALAEGVGISGQTVRFVVSAPSGATVLDKTVDKTALDEPVTLQIDPVPLVSLEHLDDVAPEPVTRRVAGRVLELDGNALPAGLQVVVMARRAGSPPDVPPEPVMVARVDRAGAFFGEVPNVEYDDVTAEVPGVAAAIPVPLEGGRIAANPVLPLKLLDTRHVTDTEDGGCACGDATTPRLPTDDDLAFSPETFTVDLGTGECVKFNKPNRVVEEFDFFTVVRTSEPQLRRLTLGEVDRTTPQAANGGAPGGQAADTPMIAVSYQLRLETRELDDKAAFQVSLVTEHGTRILVTQTPQEASDILGSHVSASSVLIIGDTTDEETLKWVTPTGRNWSVSEGTDALGIDLRSIRRVEVIGAATDRAWALVAIGISATTSAGDVIPVWIEGSELYQGDPWLKLFKREQQGFSPSAWSAPAGVAVARAYAMRSTGTNAPRTVDRELTPAALHELARARDSMILPASGRDILSPDVGVDWDETPTFAQAASVAHGHLLQFKQRWYADGYSLGDLLYSLPLAPGQKKLISVVDWERRERTERVETTTVGERMNALVSRDRDLGEIVTGALTESMRGGSRNTTEGIGMGTAGAGSGSYYGMNFGSVLGVSGGYGASDSSAWQVSGKTLAADSMQTLRDKTLQSASAVRSLRTSVVQSVSQGESTRVTTEVVANHNHCHALTVQYFEVLRHLRVKHELAGVRECLFVPLPISPFNGAKTLRWRQSLEAYLRRAELAPAFDATRRVETNWSEVDYPVGRYADEQLTEMNGELELTISIPLPPLPPRPLPRPEQTADEVTKTLRQATDPTAGFLGVLTAIATGGASLITNEVVKITEGATKSAIEGSRALADEMLAETSPQAQYEKFHRDVMPGVAIGFVDQLELYALVRGSEMRIPADFTLVSDYRPAVALLASVHATLPPGVKRGEVTQIRIKSRNGLPSGCRAIVNSATFRYRTRLFEHALVDDRRANDDIDLPVISVSFDTIGIPIVKQVASGDGAALSTPVDAWEQRNPRTEDRRLTATLIEHLNECLEFYHHALWWTMDPNRRYMLLDGFEAPGSSGRSIASVVENRLIGIIGNSLVLPVANGVQLDPRIKAIGAAANGNGNLPKSLRSLYNSEPLPPASVALPTRGVFAEAVMGSCNACEQIDESRFWRWEESPIDEPPAIEPASTASRRAEPQPTTPTTLPTPIVAIQNAPEIPTPAGVAVVLDELGKQVFKDITGLEGTQANAAAAYAKALDTALAFGKEASALTQQAAALGSRDRTLAAIDKAESDGKLTKDDAKRLRTTALEKSIGADGGAPRTTDVTEKLSTIKKAENDDTIDRATARRLAETVLKPYAGDTSSRIPGEREAATKKLGEIPGDRITELQVGDGVTLVRTVGGVAPAQKTGVGGTGGKAPSSDLLDHVLKVIDWADKFATAALKSEDGKLGDALADAALEIAKDELDTTSDAIPMAKAFKKAVRLSLVFADAVGELIEPERTNIQKIVDEAASFGDEVTEEDKERILHARSFLALGMARIPVMLEAGFKAVVDELLDEATGMLAETLSDKVREKMTTITEHFLKALKIDQVLLEVAQVVENNVPAERRKIYNKLGEKLVRQLIATTVGDKTQRARLEALVPGSDELATVSVLRGLIEIGIRDLGSSVDPLAEAFPGEADTVTLSGWVEYEAQQAAHTLIKELQAKEWTFVGDDRDSGSDVDETAKTIKVPRSYADVLIDGAAPALPTGGLGFLESELATDEAALASLYEGLDVGIVIRGAGYQATIDSAPATTRASKLTNAHLKTSEDALEAATAYAGAAAALRARYTGTSLEDAAETLVPLDFDPATLRADPPPRPESMA